MELFDLLRSSGFQTGLAVGVVAFAAAMLPLLGARPSADRPRWLPWTAGLALVAGSLAALAATDPGTPAAGRLLLGLVLLVIGPYHLEARHRGTGRARFVGPLAALPGALVVAWAASAGNDRAGIFALVLAVAVLGGWAVEHFDLANARAGLAPVLLAVTVLGIYTSVPDTEEIVVIVGVALPLAFLGWPVALAAVGPGAYATAGLVAWVAAVGGRGRAGSVVGAVACLGVLLLEPLVRAALGRRARVAARPLSPITTFVIVVHAALVVAVARIAGLESSAASAAALAVAMFGVAAAVLALGLVRPSRTRRD